MTTQEAVEHYGSARKLADILDCWPHVIYRWGMFPPKGRQYEIEVKTDGKLKAETE